VLHQLATVRHRTEPPLIGFVRLSEFLANGDAITRIGLRESLHAVIQPLSSQANARNRTRLRGLLAPPPRPNFNSQVSSSHRLRLPYRVSPIYHRDLPTGHVNDCLIQTAPSKVCSPSAFYQSRGATYPRQFPNCRLSYALRVSHPLDVLLPARPPGLISFRFHSWGFPSRFCSAGSAVRTFCASVPSGVF
jgi:hypothetical protein